MTLHDLEVGTSCKILNITENSSLRHRFLDFGIKRGCKVKITKISLSKLNITVIIKGHTVALRNYEASLVEVVKV